MTQSDLQDLLLTTAPFDQLSLDEVQQLIAGSTILDLETGSVILEVGDHVTSVVFLLEGQIEVSSATGKVFGRLSRAETFGFKATRGKARASYRAAAVAPSKILRIPKPALDAIWAAHPDFDAKVPAFGPERFMKALDDPATPGEGQAQSTSSFQSTPSGGMDLMTMTVRDLMTTKPITVPPDTTILDAAKQMRSRNISCLPIVDGGALVGILTDGDLRDRVLAEGAAIDQPVKNVMTPKPITLPPDALAFDALVTMMHKNISHLPITDKDELSGIVTHTNLVRAQSRSAVYMIGEIHRLSDARSMAEVVSQIPTLLVSLVDAGTSAHKTGHIITSIADAATIRLLRLAEDKLGPPPVPYLWLACGSQGRQEQTGVSDQDNCLFLDDAYDAEAHGAYFEALAKDVCDGLDRCGYVYCPGDMMATNPKWRQPLHVWRGYFQSWIQTPQPMAQMLASVMFDLRPIYGQTGLFENVQTETLEMARKNSIFTAHMVMNSMKHTPPLGLFGQLTTTKTDDGRHAVDMKHSGVVPIVDIARVYALSAGITAVNTHRRLEAGREASVLSQDGARSLLAAFEFIAMTRLRHQAEQIRSGNKPDNFLVPVEISPLERTQLKDTFAVVKTIQQSLANARQMGG
ncbi:MAG: DUF294 nucleotidyltransferase-like domain-containing protein [Pseudomonadota bacterium]